MYFPKNKNILKLLFMLSIIATLVMLLIFESEYKIYYLAFLTFTFLLLLFFHANNILITNSSLMNNSFTFSSSEKECSENNLLRKYEIEASIARITTSFAYSDDLDSTINDALESLGTLFDASRTYVFFFRDDDETMDNVYEWCASGVESQKDNLRELPKKMFPWWIEKLQQKEIIRITDVEELPLEASAEKDILSEQNIKSVLALPLYINNKLSGFVGFDNIYGSEKWTYEEINALEIFANSIGLSIKEKQVEQSLKSKENALSNQLSFESLISEISIGFLSIEPENIDEGIKHALEKISVFLNVDRSYIFSQSDDKATISNTYEWCATGIAPQKEDLQGVPTNKMPNYLKKLSNLESICISSTEGSFDKLNDSEKRIVHYRKAKSIISVPMVYKEEFVGILGFDTINNEKEWSENSIRLITVLAQMFVATIHRKKDSEQLNLEREQLLSIFDSIDEIIYVSDPQTYEVIYANQYLRKKIGVLPVGKKCYEVFRNFDSPCDFCTNDIILANKNESHQWTYYNSFMEAGFVATDRIIKWPDGRDLRLEVAQDITNITKAEEYARKNEERFQQILENSPTSVIIIDHDGNVEYVNKMFIDTFGYSLHDIVTINHWWKNAAPDHEFLNKKKIKVEETNISRDWLFKCKDGSSRNVEFHFAVTSDRVIIVMNDITERKTFEKALLLDESRLEAIQNLNYMSDLSIAEIEDFALEEAIRLTQSKVGYLAFLDKEKNSLVMLSWSKNAMSECAIKDRKVIYELDDTGIWGEAVRQRKPVITNDFHASNPLKKGYPEGHVDIKRHMNIPIMYSNEVVGVAGVGNKESDYNKSDVRQLTLLMQGMYNLVKRKETEDELNQYAKQLHRINIDLSIANEELKSLDELKSNFLSSISHELKTPLIPILGFSEMVADEILGSLNPEQKKAMDTVHHSSKHLKRLIESLIFMSTLDAKQFNYDTSTIEVKPIVKKALNTITLENRDKNIKVELDCQATRETIKGDGNYITELFMHLIDNAFKFTQSTGKITITSINEEGSIHYIIEDTGIGIPKSKIRKTFDSFYQIDSSLSRKYGGTGIGLNMCKRITEGHKGKLWIESEENVGTKVHVKLPVLAEDKARSIF